MERKAQNAVPGVRTLEEKLLEALAESLKQVCATIRGRSDDILQPLERPLQVGIAFSGGRDSMALLEAAHRLKAGFASMPKLSHCRSFWRRQTMRLIRP